MDALRRILAVAWKELLQLARDRPTFRMIVGIPVLQMLLFGYAINFDVRGLATGVVDEAGTSLSRQIVGDLRATQVVEITHVAAGVAELPALIGAILHMTMVIFTAGAIVRERERGNLELLITTLVLGLVVSTLARSQFQAFQLAFFTMLPSILLSGFMFPFDGMPRLAQWIAQVLPLTHFIVMIRGIVLRGAGLAEFWPQLAKLATFLAVMLAVAVLRFRKRLD